MPRTDRVREGGLDSWIEYESAIREPNGTWKATAAGRVRFQHDDGATFVAELDTKTAYGRTAEQAESGAKHRVMKGLQRVVDFMKDAMEPT